MGKPSQSLVTSNQNQMDIADQEQVRVSSNQDNLGLMGDTFTPGYASSEPSMPEMSISTRVADEILPVTKHFSIKMMFI